MKTNKLISLVLVMVMLFSVAVPVIAYAAEKTVTVYAMDGRTKQIPASKKDAYLKVGWYDSPIITVYAMDGRTAKIPSSKKAAYLKVGWYDSPIITVYAADGRTAKIPSSKKAAYLKVGWYDSPVITMYSADGKTKNVPSSKKDAYKKVGWYEKRTDVYSLLYSADGRIIEVLKKDVSKYTAVGWKTSYVELNVTEEAENHKYGDGVLRVFGPSKLKENIYKNNKDIKTAYIGGNVTEIGDYEFLWCEKLSRVELSDSVQSFGGSVFSIDSLKRIGIPKSVTSIDYYLSYGKDYGLVIYCEKGSEAESYAKRCGIKYVYATMIYCLDGRTMMVDDKEKAVYLSSGLWSDAPCVAMYTTDGRMKAVNKTDVAAYKKVGWYDNKAAVTTTMYSLDGRTKQVFKDQVAAHKKVGWYDSPVITVYAPDGRTKKIPSSDKAAHLKAGWYDVPVLKIGAADGRTKVIPASKLEAYKKVGWKHISSVKVTATEKGKTASYLNLTNRTYVYNWATTSSIQQFKYKNEGMGYAYLESNSLKVVLPKKTLKIAAKYPKLGDVIADNNGNLYVVWGKANNTGNTNVETIVISKYTPNGAHVKTTGFTGKSPMGTYGTTKIPFNAGKCSSAIGNGKLIVNYARTMYNGHQSNNVIGVNLADMSPVDDYWSVYTSHSFNQSVIFSQYANGFVFADQGDAYDRGFIITYDNREKNIFNFYLPQNSNYNMSIVNKTFAQMGNLLETDKGVVLVAASAKSISESAKKEKQNLFIQIFNPKAAKVDEKMFVGGVKRSGATSFDINDNQNKPLTPVTDYGVHWITNYTDADVVAPHAVVAGDKIVILWNNSKTYEAYYTILASDGAVIVPPTSLGKDVILNSMEEPIYHNGKVYWVATQNGKIKVMSMSVPN